MLDCAPIGMHAATRNILRNETLAAWVPVAVFVVCYLPFLGKPFHIDDPMYIWAARQIQAHPLDFYGFSVNWHGTTTPMVEAMQNPPLVSYYIAAAAAVVGWSEVGLHLAMLLPAIGVVLGTYHLARRLSAAPLEAALAGAFTPAFFVSSTTVMCDVLTLCAWVWAVLLWMRGLESRRPSLFAASAALVAVAALTKYVGIALIPLLLAYTALKERRRAAATLWLCIPLAALLGYEWFTRRIYGRGLILDAASYANDVRRGGGWAGAVRLATGLAFTGGSYLTALFYAPRLWSRRGWAVGLAITAAVATVLLAARTIGTFPLVDDDGLRWPIVAQYALLVALGTSVVALAVTDLAAARDADSALLLLWVLGTMVFAIRVNWSINVRSLLPMMPAIAVLLVRRVARQGRVPLDARPARRAWPVIAGAVASIAIGYADLRMAATARDGARWAASVLSRENRAVWFQGHWGFQYYAEQFGLRAVDLVQTIANPGDAVVIPGSNTNVFELPPAAATQRAETDFYPLAWLTTLGLPVGASFYSDVWGPLPFALGRVQSETYKILVLTSRIGPPK